MRLEEDPSATGWSRFKISLPQSVRAQWMDDLVFNEEWRELISDFDQKFLGIQAAVAMERQRKRMEKTCSHPCTSAENCQHPRFGRAGGAAESLDGSEISHESPAPPREEWSGEPRTLEELLETWILTVTFIPDELEAKGLKFTHQTDIYKT